VFDEFEEGDGAMASGEARNVEKRDDGEAKKPWNPMTITYVGEAKEVVRSGGGKVSISAADTGDARKPKGQG